ncbi:MAG TPA: BRCT domain-containing protein [Gallionella sp.]|nr:BRCT domain-containing protein [Gallionella sp.]
MSELHKIAGATHARLLARATDQLLGICSGIAADGQLHDTEIQFLSTWLAENKDATTTYPGQLIAERIRDVLADGVITTSERSDLLETLKALTGHDFLGTGSAAPEPTSIIPYDDEPHIIYPGMAFCFTGRFLYGTRAKCERTILALGGTAVDSVSRKLDYLIVGTLIEPTWRHTSYGRKIIRAIELIDEGHGIAVINEKSWTDALSNGR